MSNGPVSGGGIAVAIPQGKTAFWTVTAQAAVSQFVQLRDSLGNVVFTASGASPGGHSPSQLGAGAFVANDPTGAYTLYVGTNGGQTWSSVLWDSIPLTLGGAVMNTTVNFISEDGADQDYNDSHTAITWFDRIG